MRARLNHPQRLGRFAATLVAALWTTSTTGCPRPTSPVSKDTESCIRSINSQIARVSSQIQQCVSKCEFSYTKGGGEACTAPDTGEPLKDKQIDNPWRKHGNIPL